MSGSYGSQLPEVAREVAERLGFGLVDEEIVVRAASAANLRPEVVANAERRQSFLDRALEGLTTTADASSKLGSSVGGPLLLDIPLGGELRDLIRTAVEEAAERGSAVIVLHAASHALASRADVLRVLVTATHSVRCEQVALEQGLSEKEARRAVDHSDAARADDLKRFHGVRNELPTQYDLVVSTDRLSCVEAAALISYAAGN